MGEYIIEFIVFVPKTEVEKEIYGNYQENDLIEQYIYFKKDKFKLILSITSCSSTKYRYNKNQQESYCLSSCNSYPIKTLYQDENENICYSECPENYLPNENNICIEVTNPKSQTNILHENNNKEEDTSIKNTNILNNAHNKCNDINKDLLISDYKSNNNLLEFKELEDCSTTYYCYSSDTDIDSLLIINPKLTYIDIKDFKNELINNNLLNENADLLIISKKQFNSNIYTYELYDTNGNKINTSIYNNKKFETVSSIENTEIYEKALALYNQGYDIFNLSSSFYNDICISVNINGSDITLSIRQKDIKPDDNLLCSDGCTYNGVNLTTKRISCICDINNNKNKTIHQIEEVEENFFSYILGMINYKIIKCYILLKNLRNYYNNYGFFIGAGIYFIIFILFFIYLFFGRKSITLKYLRNEPKTLRYE